MASNTYVALDKKTVGSAVAYIEFTGVNQTYTDLVIVASGFTSTGTTTKLYVGNGSVDTGSNYQWQAMSSNGSSTFTYAEASAGTQNERYANWTSSTIASTEIHIQNYASGYKKGWLSKGQCAATGVDFIAGTWNSTSAIDTIRIATTNGGSTFSTGTTFSLYGIRKEGTSPAPKATGGAIYSDSTYYYHVFGSTGVFTPLSSLTADVLVTAGGGAGANGGGGAGGVRQFNNQSLTTVNYTCTVGAGGTGAITNTRANAGSNSSFAGSGFTTIAANGGGGGGGTASAGSGGSGGSGGGGGGRIDFTAGTGNVGGYSPVEGYAGGAGYRYIENANEPGGGGGGAGGVGQAASSTTGKPGDGGIGATSSLITAINTATGIGQIVSSTAYIAGGGGGGNWTNATTLQASGGNGGGGKGGVITAPAGTNGLMNTGSGGGAASGIENYTGGSGGSGVIVVRYLKA